MDFINVVVCDDEEYHIDILTLIDHREREGFIRKMENILQDFDS